MERAELGVNEVQVSFASLKPSATIEIGGTADWALVTDDALCVASTKPYAVLRIDPSTNKILTTIRSGESSFRFCSKTAISDTCQRGIGVRRASTDSL